MIALAHTYFLPDTACNYVHPSLVQAIGNVFCGFIGVTVWRF